MIMFQVFVSKCELASLNVSVAIWDWLTHCASYRVTSSENVTNSAVSLAIITTPINAYA